MQLTALRDGHVSSGGDIVCPYHGWQFDAEGKCTHDPQVGTWRPLGYQLIRRNTGIGSLVPLVRNFPTATGAGAARSPDR